MADNEHTKGDDDHGHGGDHGGDHGDHGGGSDKHGKASGGGGGGGGSGVAKVLRNPVTWAVAGVGALLVAVFASGVQMPSVGTTPTSYDDPAVVADGSSPDAPRSTTGRRYSARTCASMIERAQADHGRDWERELSRKTRADCGRSIQEARAADRRWPQQAERPRGQAPGAGDVEIQRMDVAYGDLDLNTSAGAQRFLQRLERAAVQVCGGRPDIRDLEARRAFKDCVQRNMDSAVAQLRAPRVTELHRRSAG